jgi:hypothetical protein
MDFCIFSMITDSLVNFHSLTLRKIIVKERLFILIFFNSLNDIIHVKQRLRSLILKSLKVGSMLFEKYFLTEGGQKVKYERISVIFSFYYQILIID